MNAYHNQYQHNHILTASPEKILIMLYDGAIRFATFALKAMEEGNIADKGMYIGKTMAIITEFSNSLNHEIGGQIATDLDALYAYMLRELSMANVNNDSLQVKQIVKMLAELRETWAEAMEIHALESARHNREDLTAPASL